MTVRFLPIVVLALLTACSSQQPSTPSQKDRYGGVNDGAPLRQLDPDSIADAVPRWEPITNNGNKSPYEVMGRTYYVLPAAKNYRAKGIASWYGTKFHGHTTSNMEIYNLYGMTAAHKTLPIPSYVRVTNLSNGRTAIVRVNDRGPFVDDREIDLSYAAAVKLGYHNKGTAPILVEAIDTRNPQALAAATTKTPRLTDSASRNVADNRPDYPPVKSGAKLYVQIGAFTQPDSAERLRSRVSNMVSEPVEVKRADVGVTYYRVRVGPLANEKLALEVQDSLYQQLGSEPRIVTD
jgi:rare lipoprotein A